MPVSSNLKKNYCRLVAALLKLVPHSITGISDKCVNICENTGQKKVMLK
jgi:hypothetical protein